MDNQEGRSPLTLADAQRFLGYLRMGVVGLVAVLGLAVEMLVRIPRGPLRAPVLYVFYALAAADAVIAAVLRRRMAGPAAQILRQNPEDAAALANWTKGQVVALPMALGVGFLGVMARVIGAAPLAVAPFYLLALLLLFTAGRDDIPV